MIETASNPQSKHSPLFFYKILWWIKTKWNLNNNSKLSNRKLEIGPGTPRVSGFETINLIDTSETDYILDAGRKLPFADNTFDVVYASHVLEHTVWYQLIDTVREWVRILNSGGRLEIWVPDGHKICKAFVKCEDQGTNKYIMKDGWFRFNDAQDPCIWVNGRIFTYGDGTGNLNNPNWHHAIFSYRYLKLLLMEAGLQNVRKLKKGEVRGYDHGWINLGVVGEKP